MENNQEILQLRQTIDGMKERITRLEEQMKTVYNRTERIEEKLDRLIEQGAGQDVELAKNEVQISNGERMFWLIISAVIGLVMYYLKSSS